MMGVCKFPAAAAPAPQLNDGFKSIGQIAAELLRKAKLER
jgi:hypothetical protein